jgi:hypothetical protein
MADCSHKLHENIIERAYGCTLLSHEQNRTFIIINNTALVIDRTNYIKRCPQCGKLFRIYIYGTWPDVRASFDGVTDLPICAMANNIEEFLPFINVCNEPRFGKNFIYGMSGEKYFIIHCIKEIINRLQFVICEYKNLYVNDKPAVCCRNINGEFILINSDGHIIETEVIHSQEGYTFKNRQRPT